VVRGFVEGEEGLMCVENDLQTNGENPRSKIKTVELDEKPVPGKTMGAYSKKSKTVFSKRQKANSGEAQPEKRRGIEGVCGDVENGAGGQSSSGFPQHQNQSGEERNDPQTALQGAIGAGKRRDPENVQNPDLFSGFVLALSIT